MEIKQVLFEDQDRLLECHPELMSQYPKLARPILVDPEQSTGGFPYLFYAIEDGLVASYFASFPDTLYHNNQAFDWAWNGNLFTDPRFRGRGLARAIVEKQLAEFERRKFIWGGVFSSPPALRLYKRMGFQMVGQASRFCLIRDVSPFVRHHVSSRLLVSFANRSYQVALAMIQFAIYRPPSIAKHLQIEQVTPCEFGNLLKHGIDFPEEKFYWGRSPNWFEIRRKKRNIDKIYTLAKRGQVTPCCFIIVRQRLVQERPLKEKYAGVNMLSVMDYGCFDKSQDFAEIIVSGILSLFYESGADIVEFVTSSPSIGQVASQCGFYPLGAGMSFKFKAPQNSNFDGSNTKLSDWHLSHYCGDAFNFE